MASVSYLRTNFLNRIKACKCVATLGHNFEMWWSNLNLRIIFTPSNFTVLAALITF